MTQLNVEKLKSVFNQLTEEQKKLELLELSCDEISTELNEKEIFRVIIEKSTIADSLFVGIDGGTLDLLYVSKGKVILKPKLINEFINANTNHKNK